MPHANPTDDGKLPLDAGNRIVLVGEIAHDE
jgi:hypothetical protein